MALQRLGIVVCALNVHVPVVLVLWQSDPVISDSMSPVCSATLTAIMAAMLALI